MTFEVETFVLFGDREALPDMVYCEHLGEQLALHDGYLSPHRHSGLHQVLLMTRGSGSALLETGEVALRPELAVNVPSGAAHGYRFAPGAGGYVVTIMSELMDHLLAGSEGVVETLDRLAVLRAPPCLNATIERITQEQACGAFGREHALRSLAGLMLGDVARQLASLDIPEDSGGERALRRRFEAMLEADFARHLTVADYAERLGVTPTHLSRVMRQATGRPASQAITARVMREACRQLLFTHLRVAEIAYVLGYSDPAYFSRAFGRAMGVSPREYRRRLADRRGAA